jgi:hypothetical protein
MVSADATRGLAKFETAQHEVVAQELLPVQGWLLLMAKSDFSSTPIEIVPKA